jgi:CDP-paratose 2-epimerase
MAIALITGSAGLVGSEAVRFFANQGFDVIGIDNDMRRYFFGADASTEWNQTKLNNEVPNYTHTSVDIRNKDELSTIFNRYGKDIKIILHAAAQPSHDWAAKEPLTDFTVNALATMNMLEATREHCPDAVFIFTSTNKVYGDLSNNLPLVEQENRWELESNHDYYQHGIDENFSVDQSLHSLFGASKLSADILVQEYGRYFNMKTACFRGGCLTGSGHSGTELHGFLAYLIKCVLNGGEYTVYGYKAKQVRDNIHSSDLINAFWCFFQNPRSGEVYNIGGGRFSNCSMLEAINISQDITGNKLNWNYSDEHRTGDHIWWISDTRKFQNHYPEWEQKYNIEMTINEIISGLSERN